ncbi:DUF1566 domain-containing protein [Salidesulfovibrio onnuriiensis]|uniref:Lcl C-terminal domain-containing protein n=1 Tax=Salidesulfovibrio onnuriiensis TaxID=2583823 RepID=UPI0011C717EA|nr:DUF1566 domain-containing protein [Salidesulfovibrio onnuriiensis]
MSKCLSILCFMSAAVALLVSSYVFAAEGPTWPVVDTGQDQCFGTGDSIRCPLPGREFSGQDAQYKGNGPAYRDNGDGTVSDLVTGLMWQKTPDFRRYTFAQAGGYARNLHLGGHDDWRVPTIKELFSIADFNGNMHTRTPYIDTRFFDFRYPTDGQRDIDAQFWSSNEYAGTVMGRQRAAFGFNFADGRIKGYPVTKGNWMRCVRGPANYGLNDFRDNGDGTVTDRATGLMWTKADNGRPVSWEKALEYAGKSRMGGHDDWRLPNIKELQSIVDYSRSSNSRSPSHRGPAIDLLFKLTDKEAWLWSSTTHIENGWAYYVAIGQATGYGPRGLACGCAVPARGGGAEKRRQRASPGRSGNGRRGSKARQGAGARRRRVHGPVRQEPGRPCFPRRV